MGCSKHGNIPSGCIKSDILSISRGNVNFSVGSVVHGGRYKEFLCSVLSMANIFCLAIVYSIN